jgi:adenylylsulfate kinase|tara:strand:+ start:148 stop:561 length:414 start_codon:yes stop_codon:yes gene_type:complete
MVIWLIGISGAGKTTLGIRVEAYLKSQNKNCYMIDGDDIRKLFDNDLGYTRDERVQNIKRIILAGYVLEQSGAVPIIFNISPFEALRKLARRKLDSYNEIYLNKTIETSKKNGSMNQLGYIVDSLCCWANSLENAAS